MKLIWNEDSNIQICCHATYVSLWWRVVETTLIEVVLFALHNLFGVEAVEDRVQRTPVPSVCHAATIVTLASQVAQRSVLHFLLATNNVDT